LRIKTIAKPVINIGLLGGGEGGPKMEAARVRELAVVIGCGLKKGTSPEKGEKEGQKSSVSPRAGDERASEKKSTI